MSIIRRQRRQQERDSKKIIQKTMNDFQKRIKGKSDEEIAEIMEEIRIKYVNQDRPIINEETE